MATDIFGHTVTTPSTEHLLTTSDNVVVTFGDNGKATLANNVTIQYGQNVSPKYVLGSATTYYVVGQPGGSATLGLAVGKSSGFAGGITSLFGSNSKCSFTNLSLGTTGTCVNIGTETSLTANIMLQQISTSIQAQGLEVGVTLQCLLTNLTGS